jgi:hypothetical protein
MHSGVSLAQKASGNHKTETTEMLESANIRCVLVHRFDLEKAVTCSVPSETVNSELHEVRVVRVVADKFTGHSVSVIKLGQSGRKVKPAGVNAALFRGGNDGSELGTRNLRKRRGTHGKILFGKALRRK